MMKPNDNTFRKYYFYIQGQMLKAPRRVFREILPDQGVKRSLGVLLTSSVIYAISHMLISRPESPFFHMAVLLLNTIGMVFIAAATGYCLVGVLTGRLIPFNKLLPIYALSSGVTLLIAWLPYSLWFTEPWKWWLIGAGLTGGCTLNTWQAITIIIGSIVIITLLFSALLPHVGFHSP